MEYKFGGITVYHLKNMKDKFEIIYDTDTDIIMLSKKTYKHREEGFNFDYKYAVIGLNMYLVTGDEQFKDNAFSVEIHLIPSPTSLCKIIQKNIKNSTDGYCDYEDIFQYGYSVRMLYGNLGFPIDNIEEEMFKIANLVESLDTIRGLFLDIPINRIGSTGWDVINECISGKCYIDAAFKKTRGD